MIIAGIKKVLDIFFYKMLPVLFAFYEKHLFFRFRKAYGYAMLKMVPDKGTNVRIHGRCTFIRPDFLELGNDVRIGNNCYFFCIGNIKIGNNVQFSRNIVIYASNHNYESTAIPYDLSYSKKKSVTIGDNVWVGMGATILPGVTIGEGAIIGMNAVVSKDVEKYAIVVGASQRVVGYRDKLNYEKLNQEEKWFGKLYPDA